MGFEQVQAFAIVLMGGCALIAAISGACAAVVKFWRYAHRDSDRNAEDINEFRDWFASDKRRIEALERKQDNADEQNKLMLRALVSILDHEIDGNNHTAQLVKSRDAINDYLIGRG